MTEDRTRRRRPAVSLPVALLLALCAVLTPALISTGGGMAAASPAKAEMAVTGAACPLLRPGAAPRLDNAESKPLPAAALPAAARPGAVMCARSNPPGTGVTTTALGRFTRDGRAPPYAY
ncbi:hypothetical protein [Actinoallomurus iriomotensis]|uniref:Uncharacterized protein n=1 Tax=Actinoallomurus iriomotensis TaxID=478107 RepID=A0A9W6VPV9_9ACTN|nr:hypothetical protein [Actinoallomurus iriomotensis]GLY80378.1 hypothetical protein Airi01_086450 [Actinoallomurus iriomotensis]